MSEQREALAEALCDVMCMHEPGYHECYGKADRVLASDALARLLADAEQRGAEQVAAALLSARVVCPVHGIPDCGPLLNGCQIPRYIAEWRGELLADLRAALIPGAADRVRAEHDCETCETCLHNGNKCCGCYDGACCQETNQ